MANTITPQIVNLNTTVTTAPTVSQLQQSGAIVSTGATTLAANGYQYCGNLAAVQALLSPALEITSLAWASGTVTATVPVALNLAVGQSFTTTIAGASPAGYNGTFTATVATTTTFTYALATNPGTETTAGTYTPPDQAFVLDAATVFFAQGNAVGVYVLELGSQTSAANGVTALTTFISDNLSPQVFYAYLIPPSWDSNAATSLKTLVGAYASPSSKTYFVITTTSSALVAATYGTNKSVLAVVPSPTQGSTELQAGAVFYQVLVNNPGAASPLAPFAYRYLYDVTPWATYGNSATINTILTAYGNIVLTGAQGGISTACLFKGTTLDGEQYAFWYGVDYFQIQVQQALAAAIINGSNSNPPLLYDQNGINTLLAIAQQIGNNAVSYGCAQSVTVTAVPFATYIAANPSNYAAGIYDGFSATLNGVSGFLSITFNLDAIAFAAA